MVEGVVITKGKEKGEGAGDPIHRRKAHVVCAVKRSAGAQRTVGLTHMRNRRSNDPI